MHLVLVRATDLVREDLGLYSSFRRNICVFHIIGSDMIVLTANMYSVLTTCLSLST